MSITIELTIVVPIPNQIKTLMKQTYNKLITILLLSQCLTFSAIAATQQTIEVYEQGQGLNHTIVVESKANFRLGFENGLNYGLSQWFDLHHDPKAQTDLTDNQTDYLPEHEQGALFNQCLNPDDLIAHVASGKSRFKSVPRSVKIIESGPIRAVIENQHHPMLGKVNEGLVFTTRYHIYGNGHIYITNQLKAIKAQTLTMWRNSIVGLSDPTYKVQRDSGKLQIIDGRITDSNKKWQPNQWQGKLLNFPDWRSYEIAANDHNTLTLGRQIAGKHQSLTTSNYQIDSNPLKYGWLRGDSIAMPRQWHDKKAKFIYAYWDPDTPAPYQNWTSASIMLIPHPKNPNQGGGVGIHGWKGFKRMYYQYDTLKLKSNQIINQDYLMVLGSNNNSQMADLRQKAIANQQANQYLTNLKQFNHYKGSFQAPFAAGFYNHLAQQNGIVRRFELQHQGPVDIFVDGDLLTPSHDYLVQSLGKSQLIQLAAKYSQYDTVAIIAK